MHVYPLSCSCLHSCVYILFTHTFVHIRYLLIYLSIHITHTCMCTHCLVVACTPVYIRHLHIRSYIYITCAYPQSCGCLHPCVYTLFSHTFVYTHYSHIYLCIYVTHTCMCTHCLVVACIPVYIHDSHIHFCTYVIHTYICVYISLKPTCGPTVL